MKWQLQGCPCHIGGVFRTTIYGGSMTTTTMQQSTYFLYSPLSWVKQDQWSLQTTT